MLESNGFGAAGTGSLVDRIAAVELGLGSQAVTEAEPFLAADKVRADKVILQSATAGHRCRCRCRCLQARRPTRLSRSKSPMGDSSKSSYPRTKSRGGASWCALRPRQRHQGTTSSSCGSKRTAPIGTTAARPRIMPRVGLASAAPGTVWAGLCCLLHRHHNTRNRDETGAVGPVLWPDGLMMVDYGGGDGELNINPPAPCQ